MRVRCYAADVAQIPGEGVLNHIHYFCAPRHTYTLGIFAAFWAREIGPAIRIIPYNALPFIRRFEQGAFIFTDFDRISATERTRLGQFADQLEANQCTVLNHPSRWLGRLDLLHAWHAAGINDFTAYRLAQWREVRKFPVFIRFADDHKKPITDLLADAAALEQALAALAPEPPEGTDRIIVEMGNAPSSKGRYRKYSAFRVGEHDYASACQSSDHWWVKFSNGVSEEETEAERRYIAENPHREQLDAVWRVARADYGRVDYCVVDGRVQAFEINSSPTIAHLPGPDTDHQAYADRHEDALTRMMTGMAGGPDTLNPFFSPANKELAAGAVAKAVLAWGKKAWATNWARRPETSENQSSPFAAH